MTTRRALVHLGHTVYEIKGECIVMSGKYNEPNFLSLIPEEEEAGGICFSKLMIVT